MPSAVDEPVEPPPIARASRFRLPRWPRWMLVAAPASLIVIVVIAIVAASAGDARSTTVPAPKLAAEPAKPAPPPVRAASPKPAPEPAEDDSEATQTTESGVPIVGTGPCQLTVNSTPAGSTVVVDGKVAGPSPIHLAGPCARRKVEVVHPRYKHAAQLVSLVEGTPKTVDLTLVRPTHKVTITTVPSGATVSIGGRRAGTSPTIVQLMGFSNLKLQITKPGYKPVTTRFYSKKSEDRLSVRLTR